MDGCNLSIGLIRLISEKNSLQKEYLSNLLDNELDSSEREEFEGMLKFLTQKYSLEYLAGSYLLMIEYAMEEMKYFAANRHYRYSKFEEVENQVYMNDEYMSRYMLGLMISGYLWKHHLIVHRWYKEKIKGFGGDNYLEIGPGHGRYFLECLNLGKFRHYSAIDLSPSSIELASEYIAANRPDASASYDLICEDVNKYEFSSKFDGLCISEVLEHLERPDLILERIHEITNKGADIYVSVPINSPAIDHIYLFRDNNEVFEMVKNAGFEIVDYISVSSNGASYEKAIKKRIPVYLAMHLHTS